MFSRCSFFTPPSHAHSICHHFQWRSFMSLTSFLGKLHSFTSITSAIQLGSSQQAGPLPLFCHSVQLASPGYFRRGFATKVAQTIGPGVGSANLASQDPQRFAIKLVAFGWSFLPSSQAAVLCCFVISNMIPHSICSFFTDSIRHHVSGVHPLVPRGFTGSLMLFCYVHSILHSSVRSSHFHSVCRSCCVTFTPSIQVSFLDLSVSRSCIHGSFGPGRFAPFFQIQWRVQIWTILDQDLL